LVNVVVWEIVWLKPEGPVTVTLTVVPAGTPLIFTTRLPASAGGGKLLPPPHAVITRQAVETSSAGIRSNPPSPLRLGRLVFDSRTDLTVFMNDFAPAPGHYTAHKMRAAASAVQWRNIMSPKLGQSFSAQER